MELVGASDSVKLSSDEESGHPKEVRYSTAAYDTISRKALPNSCCSMVAGKQMRRAFQISIGVDPFHISELKSGWFNKLMKFLKHLVSLIPFVGHYLALLWECCVSQAEDVIEIVNFCEEYRIPEEIFPSTHQEFILVIMLANIQLTQRLRPPPANFKEWSNEEISAFEEALVAKQQQLLGFFLIRLLGVGSKPISVKIPTCYQYGVGCLYGCGVSFPSIYGGSKGMAQTTVQCLQREKVNYIEAVDALKNFNDYWRELLIDIFTESKQQAQNQKPNQRLVVSAPKYRSHFSNAIPVGEVIPMTMSAEGAEGAEGESDIGCVVLSPFPDLLVEVPIPSQA